MSNQTDIKAVSYVHMGDKLVSTDELSPDQRRAFATWLKSSYLNSLFRGRESFNSSLKMKSGNAAADNMVCRGDFFAVYRNSVPRIG